MLPKTEKVAFHEPFRLTLEKYDLGPELRPDQMLLRTEYSLISPGTELALYTGTHTGLKDPANKFAKYPFYPGYAAISTVEKLGAGVTGFAVGDKVYSISNHARYNLVSVSNLQDNPIIKLPEGLSPQEAVFARIAAISMTSLHQSQIRTGDTAVVMGMGLVGNLAAQLFALQGAKVVAVDVEPGRLDIARSVGLAHTVLSANGVNVKEAVRDCLGAEPDIVVEATGVPALANEALELVRKRGQVVLLGSPRGTVVMKIYEHIHSKGVFLTGAHENMQKLPGVPNRGKTTAYVLDLISKGNLRVASLMTHCIPYGKAEEAYDMLLNK